MARIMMFTPPPEFMHLNAEGRACFCRVQSRLRAMGKWQEEYVFGLGPVASECALYLRFAREVRALKDVPPKNMRELEEDVEVTHRLAREGLERYWVISPERVPLALVNDEGLDADIVALCAPFTEDASVTGRV